MEAMTMSDLTAANCGCNDNNGNGSNWIWILILLFFLNGNGFGRSGNGCGCGNGISLFNNGGSCCEWLICILLLSSVCGGNNGCNN